MLHRTDSPPPDKTVAPVAPLDELRRRIAAIERPAPAFQESHGTGTPALPWTFDLAPLDQALPPEGLAVGGLHETTGGEHRDEPAALAFILAMLRRLERRDGRDTILLCQSDAARRRFGRAYGHGLAAIGLDPDKTLIADIRRDQDVLWAVEEGLTSGALAAVVADLDTAPFTATRRLSLAARESATPALLVRADGLGPSSAAMTRWRVSTLPGTPDTTDQRAPGLPRWRLELVRCRGGRPATFTMEWNRETGDFRLVAALADRPAAPVSGERGPVVDRAIRRTW